MSPTTTLYLIEDDQTVSDFVHRTLALRPEWRLLGHSPTHAHAMAHALDCPAGVFLVDLGLPDGRGEDLLRQLSILHPDAELLVFTVFGDESRLMGALSAGATGYVLKGCSSDELLAAIEQILAGGAPISPLLARMLLKQFRPEAPGSAPADGATADNPNGVSLTDREVQTLRLLAQGYVNKEIAVQLSIGLSTVNTYIKNLYRKLAVRSRVQAVRAAQDRGLL